MKDNNFSLPLVLYRQPGQPVRLTCQVAALPVPSITWFRLDMETISRINSSQTRNIIIDGFGEGKISSSLVFPAMSEEDLGQYVCNATNLLGTAATSFTLRFSPQPWSSGATSSLLQSVLHTRLLALIISLERLARFYT